MQAFWPWIFGRWLTRSGVARSRERAFLGRKDVAPGIELGKAVDNAERGRANDGFMVWSVIFRRPITRRHDLASIAAVES